MDARPELTGGRKWNTPRRRARPRCFDGAHLEPFTPCRERGLLDRLRVASQPIQAGPATTVRSACQGMAMRAVADDGRALDAEYAVETEPDSALLSMVLASSSGASTNRAPRNTEYRPALRLLLGRLKAREAVLE